VTIKEQKFGSRNKNSYLKVFKLLSTKKFLLQIEGEGSFVKNIEETIKLKGNKWVRISSKSIEI